MTEFRVFPLDVAGARQNGDMRPDPVAFAARFGLAMCLVAEWSLGLDGKPIRAWRTRLLPRVPEIAGMDWLSQIRGSH